MQSWFNSRCPDIMIMIWIASINGDAGDCNSLAQKAAWFDPKAIHHGRLTSQGLDLIANQ